MSFYNSLLKSTDRGRSVLNNHFYGNTSRHRVSAAARISPLPVFSVRMRLKVKACFNFGSGDNAASD